MFAPRMNHLMDVEVATKVSKNAALVFVHLYTWIINNKIEGINRIEGKTWVFQTQKKMLKYMPYFTEKELILALQKLEDAGYIIKKNLSKNKWDKTCWYALVNEPEQIENPNISNNSSDTYQREVSMVTKGRYDCISQEVTQERSKKEQATKKKNPAPVCLPLSPVEKKEQQRLEHIIAECTRLKIDIAIKVLKALVKKYSAHEVGLAIELFIKRSKKTAIPNPGGWLQKALQEDWVGAQKRKEANRKFAIDFKKHNNCPWMSILQTTVVITDIGADISFTLEQEKFAELLNCYYEKLQGTH